MSQNKPKLQIDSLEERIAPSALGGLGSLAGGPLSGVTDGGLGGVTGGATEPTSLVSGLVQGVETEVGSITSTAGVL